MVDRSTSDYGAVTSVSALLSIILCPLHALCLWFFWAAAILGCSVFHAFLDFTAALGSGRQVLLEEMESMVGPTAPSSSLDQRYPGKLARVGIHIR